MLKNTSLTIHLQDISPKTTTDCCTLRLKITALEIASVVILTIGVGLPVSIFLVSTGILLGLSSGVIYKTQQIFESKAKMHARLKTLAESKLDSISSLVLKAVEDANISHRN